MENEELCDVSGNKSAITGRRQLILSDLFGYFVPL